MVAPGRPERRSSPPTHDVGPQPAVPVSRGGGDFPPAAYRRADTVTTASTGVGRGALIRATAQRDGARRRMEATRHVTFLLEFPLEERVAAALPPPLVRIPNQGPFPRPWLPRDIPLERVAESRPREVQPPVTTAKLVSPVPPEEVYPPVAAGDIESSVPMEGSAPPASAQEDFSPVAEAVPLATGGGSAVGGARPTLTFGYMATALRPHWLMGFDRLPALAEELLSSTDTTLTLEDVILTAESMMAQRTDMALCVHGWLRDRSGPEHDPRVVLEELLNLLSSLKDVL